jgi:hypothetical protein
LSQVQSMIDSIVILIDHGGLTDEWLNSQETEPLSVLLNSILSSSMQCLNTLHVTQIRALMSKPFIAKLVTHETAKKLETVFEERLKADKFGA